MLQGEIDRDRCWVKLSEVREKLKKYGKYVNLFKMKLKEFNEDMRFISKKLEKEKDECESKVNSPM